MNMKMIIPMVMIAAMPMGADAQNKSGLVMSNLDKTTKPADDFYQFATGGWQKNNPLPAAYSRYGSFDRDSCCPNQSRRAEIADQVCLDVTRSKLWCWFRCRREECHSEHLQSLAGRSHPWRQGLLPQQRCRHCGHP